MSIKVLKPNNKISFKNDEQLIIKNTKDLNPIETITINDQSDNDETNSINSGVILISDTSTTERKTNNKESFITKPSMTQQEGYKQFSELKQKRIEKWVN